LSCFITVAKARSAGPAESPVKAPSPASPVIIEVRDAPALGPEDAPVTIVEFADFQCPYCAQASHTLQKLVKLYPTQVRWVFKHFPLRTHPRAPLVHEAALAAHEQGKFWEMHEFLFRNQNRLKYDDLMSYASKLNLDMARFTDALDTRRLRSRVLQDITEGSRLHVGVTPTYFVNGKRFSGAQTLFEFRQLIERELAEAVETSDRGKR